MPKKKKRKYTPSKATRKKISASLKKYHSKEARRRRAISAGLKRYYANLDKLSLKTGKTRKQIRRELSRNLTNIGVYNYLKRRKLKGGKRQWDVTITTLDRKGKRYSHVIKGIGGRNRQQLNIRISSLVNKQLGAWQLYLRKYASRFRKSRFTLVKELRVSFRERPL